MRWKHKHTNIFAVPGSHSSNHHNATHPAFTVNIAKIVPHPSVLEWHNVSTLVASTASSFGKQLTCNHNSALHSSCPNPANNNEGMTYTITVPAKVWHPKPEDRFLAIDYETKHDNSIFTFERNSQAISTLPMAINLAMWLDICTQNTSRNKEEIHKKYVNLGSSVNPITNQQIRLIVPKYWNFFNANSIKFSVHHFEFTVDTGIS